MQSVVELNSEVSSSTTNATALLLKEVHWNFLELARRVTSPPPVFHSLLYSSTTQLLTLLLSRCAGIFWSSRAGWHGSPSTPQRLTPLRSLTFWGVT